MKGFLMRVTSARGAVLGLLLGAFALTSGLAHQNHGTYRADSTSYWFTDTSGQPMAAIVHYPFEKSHHQAIPAGQAFPAVVFMQGGNVDAARYAWLRALAEEGYIVVLPDKYPVTAPKLNGQNGLNTNTKLTTVDVLNSAVIGLHGWAASAASPIHGRFDGQVAVAGHSLGGVIAIYAVDQIRCVGDAGAFIALCPVGYQRHPSIKAMWLIGGHLENPNGPPDPSPINKPANFPIYLLAGSQDALSTPAEVKTTFRRYQEPKLYYELQGANHFGWVDYLHPEDDLADELPTWVHPQVQKASSIDAILAFMDCNLKGNLTACAAIPRTPVSPLP
jgi:alpha-beta hydrolase superfamily lysophospholipase